MSLKKILNGMSKLQIIAIILYITYITLLMNLIVFKYPVGMVIGLTESNLVPFKTIFMYLSGYPTGVVAKNNLLGNIVPFIPLGLILPFFSKVTLEIRTVVGIALLTGAGIEITQVLFQTGVFDVDDIILNALGLTVGYGIYVHIKEWKK